MMSSMRCDYGRRHSCQTLVPRCTWLNMKDKHLPLRDPQSRTYPPGIYQDHLFAHLRFGVARKYCPRRLHGRGTYSGQVRLQVDEVVIYLEQVFNTSICLQRRLLGVTEVIARRNYRYIAAQGMFFNHVFWWQRECKLRSGTMLGQCAEKPRTISIGLKDVGKHRHTNPQRTANPHVCPMSDCVILCILINTAQICATVEPKMDI